MNSFQTFQAGLYLWKGILMCRMAWKVGMALKLLTIVLMMMQALGASPLLFKGNLAKVNARRIMLPRRLMEAVLADPLFPPGEPLNQCLGIGPVCPEGGFVECAVGGIVGCMCAFIRACQPDVSLCFFKDGKGVSSSCGF